MKVKDERHKHSPTKIALVTGGFDPIHSGHIQYLKAAATYADYLIVGLKLDTICVPEYLLNIDLISESDTS